MDIADVSFEAQINGVPLVASSTTSTVSILNASPGGYTADGWYDGEGLSTSGLGMVLTLFDSSGAFTDDPSQLTFPTVSAFDSASFYFTQINPRAPFVVASAPVTLTAVPEPGILGLFSAGLLALGLSRRARPSRNEA